MSEADTIMQLLAAGDLTAVRLLLQHGEPDEAMLRYNQIATDIYWKHKNLPMAIDLLQGGIRYATEHAQASPATANATRDHAKAMYYNLASFTWVGWAEPGIDIDAKQQAIGLEAAEAHLRLVQDLRKGPLILSRAYWMNAGHVLANGNRPAARALYDLARENAVAAKSDADELLAEAFMDIATRGQWWRVREKLSALEDGAEFVRQCVAADRVFNGR